MKKSVIAAALALTLVGTLASCGTDRNPSSNNAGTNSGANSSTNGSANGSNSGTASGSGSTAGQVSRRYNGTIYNGRSYWNDGRYTAGSNGQVYDFDNNTVSRDLTQGARDIVRDTGDMMDDIGSGIGNAARDITGNGNYSGSPSWEPDSSAVRY